jgi:hypothetical protein
MIIILLHFNINKCNIKYATRDWPKLLNSDYYHNTIDNNLKKITDYYKNIVLIEIKFKKFNRLRRIIDDYSLSCTVYYTHMIFYLITLL